MSTGVNEFVGCSSKYLPEQVTHKASSSLTLKYLTETGDKLMIWQHPIVV